MYHFVERVTQITPPWRILIYDLHIFAPHRSNVNHLRTLSPPSRWPRSNSGKGEGEGVSPLEFISHRQEFIYLFFIPRTVIHFIICNYGGKNLKKSIDCLHFWIPPLTALLDSPVFFLSKSSQNLLSSSLIVHVFFVF